MYKEKDYIAETTEKTPESARKYIADIPWETARQSHYHTSHSPEERGMQEIYCYATSMLSMEEWIQKEAASSSLPDAQAIATTELERYHKNYKQAFLAYLHAHGRCLSAMITGPANFPVRRAEKANNSCDKKRNYLSELTKKARKSIHKKLRPDLAPTRTEDDNAVEVYTKKLETAIAEHDRMKRVNVICRRRSDSQEAKSLAIQAEGYSAEDAHRILNPIAPYSPGFESFTLKNSNARIKQIRGRLAQCQAHAERAAQAAVTGKQTDEHRIEEHKLTVIYDHIDNRIRIQHDEKPDRDTLNTLKRNGWRWSRKNTAWQRQLTHNAIYSVKIAFGILLPPLRDSA